MPDDRVTVALRPDASGSPDGRSDKPVEPPAPPQKTPKPPARRWLRRVLFLLLPLVLIAGGYWYVTGGQVMSMDDALVEADKVGVSTDVSGIVKEVDVTENQQVKAGQLLYRLDDLPFRLALERAEAQLGMVRDDLNALKANYGDMQARIKQAQNDVGYFGTQLRRAQSLLAAHFASQSAFDTANRDLQNAQQNSRLSQSAAGGDRRQPRR